MNCTQCPRSCGIDREKHTGRCGVPEAFTVARAAAHFWEEPCISGTKGSGTVFFSGCSLGCVFCQNEKISTGCYGKEITDDRLIDIFKSLVDIGVHNINLVNPTHYALRLAEVLSKYDCPIPVVYNSSGYERVETLKTLEGLVDIYLPDLKYISSDVSAKYSKASDYFEYAAPAIHEMRRQIPVDVIDSDGIMSKGLIVRHLILPKNTKNSIAVLSWLHKNLPDTLISLMAQYTPCGNLEGVPELKRRITQREYDKVVNAMLDMGIENAFVQQTESADSSFIPDFDLSGI